MEIADGGSHLQSCAPLLRVPQEVPRVAARGPVQSGGNGGDLVPPLSGRYNGPKAPSIELLPMLSAIDPEYQLPKSVAP